MPFTSVQNLSTWYTIKGKAKPLVLLHGWGGSSESVKDLQGLLADHYQVITIDLPGFGKSDKPPTAWDVSNYQRFVLDFANMRGITSFSVAGHSFGGRIAILLASMHNTPINKVILIASAGIKHELSAQERVMQQVAKLGKTITSLPVVNAIQKPARKLLYRVIQRPDYYQATGVMRETMQNIIAKDLTPYLKDIHLPTLILWGTNDTLTPVQDAYVMHKAITGSTLHIFEGGTHYLVRRNYQELAQRINQFLS